MNSHPPPVRRALTAALCFGILHSSFVISRAADPPPAADLRTLLRDALFEEEATRDLDKAAAGYESLLIKWGEQRQFAAAALYRLAEVRRKQGRKDDAIKLYQRLVSEFADQDPHARLSRENLAALGAKEPVPANTPSAAPAASDEEATSLARVRKLAVDSPDLLVGDEFTDACKNGWLSVVKFLLSKNVTDKGEGIWEAAKNGHHAVIRELLALKPLPAYLGSAVEAAAQHNRLAVIKLLLENGASPDGADAKFPPLWLALDMGHTEIAELLLEHKAGVNPPAAADPPLFAAAARGDAPMVERLLALGADPQQGTRETRGARNSRPQRSFIIDSAGSTPLHAAILARNADCVSLLVKAKADPNGVNDAGWAPLHGAAHLGDVRVIELLLAAGAKPDGITAPPEKDIQPPLWHAVRESKVPAIAALLKGKADPNILYQGYTPMALAVSQNVIKTRDEIIALLLEHGADPTAGEHSAIQNATTPTLKIKLLRGYQYPKLAAKPEITLVAGNLGVENSLALLRTSDEKPASLPSLLLAWHESGGWKQLFNVALDWSAVRLFRKGGDGKMTETVIPIKTGAEFPGLQWGDVIEVISRNSDSSPQVPRPGNAIPQPGAGNPPRTRVPSSQSTNTPNGLPPETLAILRDTQTARIKLTAGGVTRDLTLRGSLRTWNPLSNEAPLVPLSVLANWCGANSTRYKTIVRVRLHRTSESGGADGIYLSTDHTLASLLPRDGDEITLLEPEETTAASTPRIGFHSPQQQFGGMIVPAQGNTLIQLLAELYAAPPPDTWQPEALKADGTPADPAKLANQLSDRSLRFQVLPHPDFSRIRVTRGNEHTDYDLVKAAAALADNAAAADARKHDVDLLDIDHVEISVLPDSAGKPFTALPEKVERLFSLALNCRVNLDDRKGDLRAVEVQWLPARYIETPAGLLPVPAPRKIDGPTRLPIMNSQALIASLFGGKYRVGKIWRKEKGSQTVLEYDPGKEGWLREGDHITFSEPQQNVPQPNFGNSGPPAPPLPANTTRIP